MAPTARIRRLLIERLVPLQRGEPAELPLTDLQRVGAEAAVLGHALARGCVEPGDLGPGEGDHARLLSLPEPVPPVADLGGVGFRLAAADDHLAVGDQPIHGFILAVVAEQGGDVLAELGALPVIAPELRGAEAKPEGAEGATGIDGRQLPVIAEHDHLAPGPIGIAQQLGEFAGADHRRLINYHDRVTIEPFGPLPELAEQAVDRGRWGVGLTLQLPGGRPGRRGADDLEAVAAEGVRHPHAWGSRAATAHP
jgi:hypothetical protein